jgi:hypothetical protein
VKPGDKVLFYHFSGGVSTHKIKAKIPATVVKVGSLRVTIELEDGRKKNVLSENLQVIK